MQGTHARMSCVCVCMCVCVSVCERVRLCVARRSTYAICALVISTHCLICKIRNDVCAILVLFIKVIGPRHELGPLVYTGTHKYTHKYTYTNTHINTSLSLNWTALEHRGTQRTFISDKLTPQSGLITSILACYDRMNLEAYIASIFHTSKYLYVDANFAGKVGKSTLPFLCHPAGGCRKHNFWTARVKSIKNYIFGILTSKAIDWYTYESNRKGSGGGVGRGGSRVFWSPPPKKLLGHFYEIVIIYLESSAQTQSIGTLFEQIGLGGVCGHVQKSEAHALGCRPRGESSQ